MSTASRAIIIAQVIAQAAKQNPPVILTADQIVLEDEEATMDNRRFNSLEGREWDNHAKGSWGDWMKKNEPNEKRSAWHSFDNNKLNLSPLEIEQLESMTPKEKKAFLRSKR